MVKNKHGGSKHKKYARKNMRDNGQNDNIKNLIKDEDQEYAFIEDALGDGRMKLICWDKKTRMGIIRGKLKRRCWMNKGDIVLISFRDFQDEKCDIIQKYTDNQVKILVKAGKITSSFSKFGKTFDDGELSNDKQQVNSDNIEFDKDDEDNKMHNDIKNALLNIDDI